MSQHGCPERLSNRSKGFQEDGPSQPTMEVLVETLTGTAFEMTVSPSDTIYAIKSKIFRVEGIPVSQQHLVYNLRELADGASLREHGVAAGARLRLVLALRGGPVATRRLPPPEPWRADRLLPDRDESEWVGEGSSSSGCKVTLLVFREGERVNLLRVRENRDGTYWPLDHKYSSSLSHLLEQDCDETPTGSLHENAVTMGKMVDLRRRMESLSLHRRRPSQRAGEKADIQKTRSEETLSVHSAEDPGEDCALYDGHYTRYDYDRYTLLPPIGTRTDSNQSLQDTTTDTERLKLPDALAGSILVKGARRDAVDDEAAIMEECLETSADECHIRQKSLATNLAPISAAKYGGAADVAAWRREFGSSSQLVSAPRPAEWQCSSASTSDLELLKRNRILPALSRHRNRSHLHLSDERLELAREPAAPASVQTPAPPVLGLPVPGPSAEPRRVRCSHCRRRLSVATEHRCRCGAPFCAPHRYAEVHGCAFDYKHQ